MNAKPKQLATPGFRALSLWLYPPSFLSSLFLTNPSIQIKGLLAVPHPGNLGMPHLLLKLKDAKHERLSSRRTSRNIDIDWNNPITTTRDAVAVMVVATSVGARSHRNDPSGVGHLVVDLSQRGGHLVGQRARDNHDVGLAGRGAENDAHSVLVVAGGR